ncbi:hypothetical protein BHM03_00052889 [Ensete ventricosum]|nr:hypothetical protein BHM03_00052889 [Ensete ventricosum]
MMGSSRDLAVGTVAVASLLIGSMLGKEVSPTKDPALYLHLAFTATFFAGLFQAALGLLRYVDRSPTYRNLDGAAPLTSVILGSVLVYLTHAENHGVQVVGSLLLLSFGDGAISCNHVHSNLIMPSILGHVSQIGYLKKGLNPPSATSLTFMPPYIMVALKTGIVTGVIALAVSSLLEGLI